MIIERDGAQFHLHPSDDPPTRHNAFWIRVSNIEALYQEYLAACPLAVSVAALILIIAPFRNPDFRRHRVADPR